MRAFIGAANDMGSGSPAEGISIVDIDGAAMTPIVTVASPLDNPMYLAMPADARTLYSVHEADSGHVSAWTVGTDSLRPLGDAQPTHGRGTCHLSVHPSGEYLFAANYGSGSISVHPILDDGRLAPASDIVQHTGSGPTTRQERPHAHMMVTDPDTGLILAVDLGVDAIFRYRLADGQLTVEDTIDFPAGAGPRHLVILGRRAYVANELDSSVSVVNLDAGRVLSTVSTLPANGRTNVASYPSAIKVTPDGRFLFVANRGPDTVAVMAVEADTVRLVHTEPTRGEHPRDLTVSPDGSWVYVANQFSNSIAAYSVDGESGTLSAEGELFIAPSPTCIVFADVQ